MTESEWAARFGRDVDALLAGDPAVAEPRPVSAAYGGRLAVARDLAALDLAATATGRAALRARLLDRAAHPAALRRRTWPRLAPVALGALILAGLLLMALLQGRGGAGPAGAGVLALTASPTFAQGATALPFAPTARTVPIASTTPGPLPTAGMGAPDAAPAGRIAPATLQPVADWLRLPGGGAAPYLLSLR